VRLSSLLLTLALGASSLGSTACGGSLPRPPAPPPTLKIAHVEVTEPPPAPRVEVIPARPSARAVWVDGAWTRRGQHWRWVNGGWFEVPAGAFYAPWSTRRRGDGTLLFANPEWVDASGTLLPAPTPVAAPPSIATEHAR
jgi:hypothetical protein